MKYKRRLIVVVGIIAVMILMVALYPQLGKKAIKNSTYDFLLKDGYIESELSFVDVRHSYIGGLLGYGQWHTSIYFYDEPYVEYHCILSKGLIPNVIGINAGGFSPKLPQEYEPLHYAKTAEQA